MPTAFENGGGRKRCLTCSPNQGAAGSASSSPCPGPRWPRPERLTHNAQTLWRPPLTLPAAAERPPARPGRARTGLPLNHDRICHNDFTEGDCIKWASSSCRPGDLAVAAWLPTPALCLGRLLRTMYIKSLQISVKQPSSKVILLLNLISNTFP